MPLSERADQDSRRTSSALGWSVRLPRHEAGQAALEHDLPESRPPIDDDAELTTHGFRSSFRDWCAERTNVSREVSEAALAHVVQDKTEAAYRRTDLFDKRRD